MKSTQPSSNKLARFSKINLFKLISVILALITTAISIVVAIASKGSESTYLVKSTVTTLFYVTVGLDLIFSVSAVFIFKSKSCSIDVNSTSLARSVTSVIYGIAALSFIPKIFVTESKFALILSILAISPIFFNKFAFMPKALRTSGGFLQACFAVLAITSFYFDLSIEINSPLKLLLQLSASAILLATLAELRLELLKPCTSLYIFSKSVCSAICFSSGILFLIINSPRFSSIYLCFSIFSVAYAVYSVCDLFSLKLKNDSAEHEID